MTPECGKEKGKIVTLREYHADDEMLRDTSNDLLDS